jgi:uncharacterized protein (DUF2147 family)
MKPVAALVLAVFAVPGLAAAQAGDPSGTWLSQSGETKVRIARCGAVWCGTIVWVAGPPKDLNNPDPGKRDRNLVGVQMISDIRPSGDGFSGILYNFQDGKTYSGKMNLKGANAMDLAGCVLNGLICRSQTWTRAN